MTMRIPSRGVLLTFAVACAACAPRAAIVDRVIDPSSRAPLLIERVPLPSGAKASAAWVSPTGGALVALGDGRFVAIGDDDRVHIVDRPLSPSPIDAAFAFADRPEGAPLAFTPSGAWSFDRDAARRVDLPKFLGDPRSLAPLGDGVLWATTSGLFASAGPRWVSLGLGGPPMQTVSTVIARPSANAAVREAWVLDGTTLRSLRVDAGDRVTWIEASPGIDLGPVRAIASMDETHLAVSSARGVAVVAPDHIVLDHAEEGVAPPVAIDAAGGFAWALWDGQILRTNGDAWESFARGVSIGPSARIAVEEGTGASAFVIDASGDLLRIDADEALRLAGLADHARVVDTLLDLEALATRSTTFVDVAYVLDGHALSHRTEAPWGWGDAGSKSRDLREIELGSHVIEIAAKTHRGLMLHRTLRFEYASPFGRVPSYAKDIAPIFASRCARCHDRGVARDLSTYDSLRALSPLVRASVREARMPPDLLLDAASVAVITAWVDGDSPR